MRTLRQACRENRSERFIASGGSRRTVLFVRVGAWCGVAAPASFVGGWSLAGARAQDYSPVEDMISDLARVGEPTRPLMTTALLAFGVLAPVWARTLGRSLGSQRVRASTTLAGIATLGVAAFPLGAPYGDGPHAVAAVTGYAAMAATPLLAAGRLRGPLRQVSWAIGTISVLLLAGTTAGHVTGLLQRAGLGVVDAWFVVMAVRELRRSRSAPGS